MCQFIISFSTEAKVSTVTVNIGNWNSHITGQLFTVTELCYRGTGLHGRKLQVLLRVCQLANTAKLGSQSFLFFFLIGTVFTYRKKEGFESTGLRCVYFVPDFYHTKDFVLLAQSYNSLEGNRKLLNRRKENGTGTGKQSTIQVNTKEAL